MNEPRTGSRRLLLIDGNSIINRAYFALAGRSTLTAPDGTPTGALNTYLNTVFKYIDEVSPTHICTLFDVREKTFRHGMYDGYKAKRKGMPEDLAVQMPLLKKSLDALRIPRIEFPGFEADDLIGTLARRGEKDGFEVFILSGDKDDFQLIDEHTVVLMPVTKVGKTSTETYDSKAMQERYGLTPNEFITLKAIMGDPSDNIPGVRGIGEKGATDLVREYKTLDRLYENLSDLSPALQKKLTENREMAFLSYELSKIRCDVPIMEDFDALLYKSPDASQTVELFTSLGLRSLLKKLEISETPKENQDFSFAEETTIPSLPEILMDPTQEYFCEKLTSLVSEPDFRCSMDLSDQTKSGEYYLIVCLSGKEVMAFSPNRIFAVLGCMLEKGIGRSRREDHLLPIGHAVKMRFRKLSKELPFTTVFDTEIAGYLLNQIEGATPSFAVLYEHAVREPFPSQLMPEGGSSKDDSLTDLERMASSQSDETEQDRGTVIRESAVRAVLMQKIALTQRILIEQTNMQKLVYEIEMPLVLSLDTMERNGVYVDTKVLDTLHDEFTQEATRLSEQIYRLSGMNFNILSPKQLGAVLFEKLGLPSGRKNSGGTYSTDSDELSRLIHEHPVVQEILNYRQISKLDSTFVVGLKKVIDPSDGRVHSNFSQAMTNTGRLSSSEPNLQNIPIRSKIGSRIRQAFMAPPGYILLDADYSQIELRLLAHLSGDENMTAAFLSGDDIHTNTAAKIFGVPRNEVQPYMRSAAKTVNFSIVYGISDFGLSTDLGISFGEAHRYIEQYYRQYPKIRAYLDSLKAMAYEKGYVETLFGRRRIMKELKSPNRNLKLFGERAAMNTPVQGTAADIIKIAMVSVSDRLRQMNLDARLILQVHDELLIECREDQSELAANLLKSAMENAVMLDVPLVAEVTTGKDWFDCKTK